MVPPQRVIRTQPPAGCAPAWWMILSCGDRRFRQARTHHRNVTRFVGVARLLDESAAAADQKIDNVVAHGVVERVLVEIAARALTRQRIFHDLGQYCARAVGHQHDAVGEIDCLVDVVRDHEHGLPGFLADAADFVLQGAARERVERGERLVHQHDLGLDRERTCDADPLLHAARQFGRAFVLRPRQADEVDEFLRVRVRPARARQRPPFRRDRIGDVAQHGAPGQQRMALEDHGAIQARAFDRWLSTITGAVRWRVEPGEDVKHRRLAAARMADHAGELAARACRATGPRISSWRCRPAPETASRYPRSR